MAAIFVITVKGVSQQEVNKNLQTIDNFMSTGQNVFNLVSDNKLNPRVYYSEQTVHSKSIHDIVHFLKTEKPLAHVIKSIYYHGSLNKV